MLGQGLLSWKAALLSCSRVPCGCAWKSQGRSLSLAPVRTVNRNRSPRLKASGRQNNVGKGSRQNRSVTSGKGLALRVGYRGPCSDVRAEQKLLDAFWWTVDSRMARIAGHGTPLWAFPVQWTTNSELERKRKADWLIKPTHCDGLKRC